MDQALLAEPFQTWPWPRVAKVKCFSFLWFLLQLLPGSCFEISLQTAAISSK